MKTASSPELFLKDHDCLTISGPTGVGKTGLALQLARVWPIEIISMDSALVYKGMDIGTAKPSTEELASVPHHLIDIRSPLESYNAAEFAQDAARLIPQIKARGNLPVIVGGTLLYYKALFDGLNDLPKTDPKFRDAVNQEAKQFGWPAMHAELARVDPDTAKRLPPTDAQRISRALEVWRSSGRTLSSYFVDKPQSLLRNKLISLEPDDRAWLHHRLEARFQQMLDAGFIEEVKTLRHDKRLRADLPSMRCVGYRQVWEMLDAGMLRSEGAQETENSKTQIKDMTEMIEKAVAATRQLAKRQLTWLRSTSPKDVIACDKDNGLSLDRDLFRILNIQN
jgi:tRNA dimethylallyltransferase